MSAFTTTTVQGAESLTISEPTFLLCEGGDFWSFHIDLAFPGGGCQRLTVITHEKPDVVAQTIPLAPRPAVTA